MSSDRQSNDEGFEKRRHEADDRPAAEYREAQGDKAGREHFFNAVYEQAAGDPTFVPWADLKAKQQLKQWLAKNPGIKSSSTSSAVDVACGLGDNAEALAAAGYRTTGFDLAGDAIEWAKKRFPETSVTYNQADLFDLPKEWDGAFDLVHECYTLQAVPPDILEATATAIARLCAPGGTLLIFTRTRPDGTEPDGPPWALEETATRMFEGMGFTLTNEHRFTDEERGRPIPHVFAEWRKVE